MAGGRRYGPQSGLAVAQMGQGAGRYPAGRICKDPGCEVHLSQYNPDPKCALHRDPEVLRYDAWRRATP